MSAPLFRPGIETLLSRHPRWIRNMNVGLLTHPAALDTAGRHSVERLMDFDGTRLKAIFGPEHGFLGSAPAGARVLTQRHPLYGIPVYSLYGKQRSPAPKMLKGLDVIVVDLQDLGARPYTYVSTLHNMMTHAAQAGVRVIVADRPIPLPNNIDGPMTHPDFHGFIASIPAPMSYGMTQAETATWLNTALDLRLDMKVAAMQNYFRSSVQRNSWPPWIPPSPGIRAWESALTYLATVFCEALPIVDNGRGTALAFQVIGLPRLDPRPLISQLRDSPLRGVTFHPVIYKAAFGIHNDKRIDGIRLAVTDPDRFQPVTTSIYILQALMQTPRLSRIWRSTDARPKFFDTLYATDAVRQSLTDDVSAADICAAWRKDQASFRRQRGAALLYQKQKAKA